MLLSLAQWVQSTRLSVVLSGSTWAYPVIGGLHVLGIAWFGGVVLLSALHRRDREMGPRPAFFIAGGTFMFLTGALLFAIESVKCVTSQSFWVKILLLVTLAATSRVRSKMGTALTLTLWAAVLLSSRGIAFF